MYKFTPSIRAASLQNTVHVHLSWPPRFCSHFRIVWFSQQSEETFLKCGSVSSVAQLCLTLRDPMSGFPVHHQFLELTQIHVHWVSNAIQPSHPLSYPFLLPSVFPSIRVFSNESVLCIRWPNYWSFSFSTSTSKEYSGLISFRMDCFDLLAVQGTLKSLLQHHSSKASVLRHSAFFIVQFSHPYMTTGKTTTLTRWTFAGKVNSSNCPSVFSPVLGLFSAPCTVQPSPASCCAPHLEWSPDGFCLPEPSVFLSAQTSPFQSGCPQPPCVVWPLFPSSPTLSLLPIAVSSYVNLVILLTCECVSFTRKQPPEGKGQLCHSLSPFLLLREGYQ